MAGSMSRERRLEALEQRKRAERRRHIPIVFSAVGEAEDSALRRYIAEHGDLSPSIDGEVDAVVVVPVVPRLQHYARENKYIH